MLFCFAQFKAVESKNIHHSFVGWTGIELSCPQRSSSPRRIGLRAVVRRKPTVADGFPGKSAWGSTPLHWAAEKGQVAAAELLLSKGAAVDAKKDDGRGLNPGSRRQKSSLELGALQNLTKMFRAWNCCIFSKCLAKSWLCTPNVGISDHK